MTQDLKSRLAQIKALAERATPGRWVPERFDSDNGYIHFSVNDPQMQQVCFCHEDMHPKTYRADAAFIASARSDVPALVAAVEIAVGALNRYEPVLRKFGCTPWGDHDDPSWCDEECNDSGKGLRQALTQIGAALGIEEGT